MLRLAVLAALVAMSVGVLTAGPQARMFESRWYGQPNAHPLQGDITYRLGRVLDAAPSQLSLRLGVIPEDLLQAGIAAYERLALRPSEGNIHAMFRLAVIYARRGHPEEATRMLERLVQADLERAGLYLAVSGIYETGPVPQEELRNAVPLLEERGDWIARQALADLYRRMGETERAAEVEQAALQRDRLFAGLLVAVAVLYLLLAAAGMVMILIYLWGKLFRVPQPRPAAPFNVTWTVLDALEVAAVLLFAMVFIGLMSDVITRGWDDTPGWPMGLLMLVSYLAFCVLVLLVIRRRMGPAVGSFFGALGLGKRISLWGVLQGTGGYAVFIAVVAVVVVVFLRGGMWDMPAAQTTMDLLQRATDFPELALYFVLICVAAPILEEIIFRGFIYAGFRKRFQPLGAVVISALLFGAAHLALAFGGMAAVGLVGVLLAVLYERTRSLWPSIIAHGLHNTLVFIIVVSAGL